MADVVIMKESDIEKKSIVIANIVLQSPDRTPKDVANFISAMEASEFVHWPSRVELYDIYSRLELDGHFTGVWNKRVETVLNKKIRYLDKTGKKVDEMDKLIRSEKFRDFIKLRMDQKKQGLSGAEFIPGPAFTFISLPRKHIKPEKRIISKEQYMDTGINYDGVWNILILGSKEDKGFLLQCAIPILYKQGAFGDWAQFIEIYGHPARLFKYDVYDDKTRQEATNLQKNAGSSMSMVIPKQLEFEMLDGKTSNSNGELQDKFTSACNAEVSVVVLGNTESTTSSKSSGYAQAETHSGQQDEIFKSDEQDIYNTLNHPQFANIVGSYGWPVSDGGYFEYEQEVDLVTLGKRKDIDTAISKIVPVGDDYFYETYHIPKPDNYDELKGQMEEDKQARINPQNANNNNVKPAADKNKKADKKPKAKDKLNDDVVESSWHRIRTKLADFFDPARQ